MDNYFSQAGDLGGNGFKTAPDEVGKKEETSYFRPAGDLETKKSVESNKPMTADEIDKYVKSFTSGKRTPPEFGSIPPSAATKFVTLDEFREMVSGGDNIIRAKYFDQMGKIEVEYETFNLENTSGRHR